MDKDFKEYLKNAKNRFKEVIIKYPYEENKELHTEFDSFLLAYEQAENKALNLPIVGLRSEQLSCDHEWQTVFHHDKIIGRYCPTCERIEAG